jgi:hypothetical protein
MCVYKSSSLTIFARDISILSHRVSSSIQFDRLPCKPLIAEVHLIYVKGCEMIKITCDMCDKVRPQLDGRVANDSWILGYDLEVENSNALQRSLRFLPRWDNVRVMDLGSIHICSEECKDQYIKEARAAA